MEFLKISAVLRSGLGAYDNWSPDLGSLLEFLWFQRRGLLPPSNPAELRHAPIPLAVRTLDDFLQGFEEPVLTSLVPGDWFWSHSAPIYQIAASGEVRIRKRVDPHVTSCLENRSIKIDSQTGAYKSYDLPIAYRLIQGKISWFVVGDAEPLRDLLKDCHAIGKKRAAGLGQVERWVVEPVPSDYSLWGPSGELMRPLPTRLLSEPPPGCTVRTWAFRPCPKELLSAFREPCYLPTGLVRYADP